MFLCPRVYISHKIEICQIQWDVHVWWFSGLVKNSSLSPSLHDSSFISETISVISSRVWKTIGSDIWTSKGTSFANRFRCPPQKKLRAYGHYCSETRAEMRGTWFYIFALHPTAHKKTNANAQRGSSPNHHVHQNKSLVFSWERALSTNMWCVYSPN